MEQPNYFKRWIRGSEWAIRIALFIVLLCALAQFGSFALTQNFVIAHSGVQTEDITFAFQITYVAIIPFISINFRLMQYFEMRSYLLTGIVLCVVLSFLSMHADDLVLFCLLRFMNGLSLSMVSGGVLILIFARLEKEKTQIIGLSVLYGTVLGNGVLVGLVASGINTSLDWKHIYYYLILSMMICIGIVLMIIRRRSGHNPPPLGKVDKLGWYLLSSATAAFAFVCIYGPKHEWFEDKYIISATGFTVIMSLLFYLRQKKISVPLIDVTVLKNKKFLTGLMLLGLYYCLKDSINLIYAYAGTVLMWPPRQVIFLGLFNVFGIAISMWVSAELLLKRGISLKYFLLSGFSLMLLYHLIIYFILTVDLNFTKLIIPVILQGASSGMLFVPIVLFSFSAIPQTTLVTGIVLGAYARFLASLISIIGLYELQLNLNLHYRNNILSYLTPENSIYSTFLKDEIHNLIDKGYTPEMAGTLVSSIVNRRIQLQDQLLGYKSIFLLYSLIISGILLFVLGHIVTRKFTQKRSALETRS